MTDSSRRSTAILIVNGFDRSNHWGDYDAREPVDYPWIELCLRQIERHTERSEADVFVYDNSRLTEHRKLMRSAGVAAIFPSDRVVRLARPLESLWPKLVRSRLELQHAFALDYLVEKISDRYRWLITLDSDSFPVRDGWVTSLTSRIESGAAVIGVWRDEMRNRIRPFVHVSGLCMETERFGRLDCSFSRGIGQDLGQNITDELQRRDEEVVGLPRTNVENPHYLMAGIYGNLLYHHGAGSRRAAFWTSGSADDEALRVKLMHRAFEDLEGLVGELTGCPYGALPAMVAQVRHGS